MKTKDTILKIVKLILIVWIFFLIWLFSGGDDIKYINIYLIIIWAIITYKF
jgi:hypothetical protein